MAGRQPRVLIVEDEELVRAIAQDEFTDAGFVVVTAANGEQALEQLQADPGFDLLFTDIRMPGGIDGWSVAERARRIKPDIAVIYATGYSEDQASMVASSIFLKKPYRMPAVIAAAQSLGVQAS
jgi:CheY-like chemotaxis protein